MAGEGGILPLAVVAFGNDVLMGADQNRQLARLAGALPVEDQTGLAHDLAGQGLVNEGIGLFEVFVQAEECLQRQIIGVDGRNSGELDHAGQMLGVFLVIVLHNRVSFFEFGKSPDGRHSLPSGINLFRYKYRGKQDYSP